MLIDRQHKLHFLLTKLNQPAWHDWGDKTKPGAATEPPRKGEKGDMEKELTSVVDLAFKFIEAGWVEFPGAVMKRLTAAGAEQETHEAGWKAYDAWVRLAD